MFKKKKNTSNGLVVFFVFCFFFSFFFFAYSSTRRPITPFYTQLYAEYPSHLRFERRDTDRANGRNGVKSRRPRDENKNRRNGIYVYTCTVHTYCTYIMHIHGGKKANKNMHNETIFYGQQLEMCPPAT